LKRLKYPERSNLLPAAGATPRPRQPEPERHLRSVCTPPPL